MLIRVAMPAIPDLPIGANWPFPTAGLVSYDPIGQTAIFDVPNVDAPSGVAQPGTANMPNTSVGPVLINPAGANVGAWWQALQAKYPALNGMPAPNIK